MAGNSPKPLTAADLMTSSPRTCSSFSSILEAVMIFRDADCGAVPVLDDGKPVGVLTDRDVALALTTYGERLPSVSVSEVMTRGVVSASPEEPLADVVERFGDQGVRRLLVMDSHDLLVGIIAWADVAPYVSDRAMGRTVSEVVEHP